MKDSDRFPGMEAAPAERPQEPLGEPRLVRPDRSQMFLDPVCLDERLPMDHRARVVWAVVEGLDLSAFYEPLKARGSEPGRPAIDPRVLVALWLYATLEGIGSARELARLCRFHDAYRWLCGGISMNYHTLSDFRVGHGTALDGLLTQMVASLADAGVVDVQRTSQDGARIRASAGSSSFRRQETLEQHLEAARERIERLKQQLDDSVPARKRAARQRAAREQVQHVKKALEEVRKVEAAKKSQKKKPSKQRPARASTTDPDAHVMKMGDGGFRPAYNAQVATDTSSRAVVGVEVSTSGSDANESEPMRKQVEQRANQKVREHLMDGGYVGLQSVENADRDGVTVYAPVPEPKKASNPYERRPKDSDEIAAWRERMGTEQAKEIYKQRASTSETVNADLKEHRGLAAVRVRGKKKVKCLLLWWALAYDILHFSHVLVT